MRIERGPSVTLLLWGKAYFLVEISTSNPIYYLNIILSLAQLLSIYDFFALSAASTTFLTA